MGMTTPAASVSGEESGTNADAQGMVAAAMIALRQ
jgi:hypothetical protein